jgi:hypothetical protein
MREPERLDLSALDPTRDQERWERMVGQIMWRSKAELQRRQGAPAFGLFDGLVAWSRPALATAAALTLLSLAALARQGSTSTMLQTAYFESSGMPEEMSMMLEEGEALSTLDLMVLSGEN